jgi:hypothetical protein
MIASSQKGRKTPQTFNFITREKDRAGVLAQVVGCLPGTHETLSSKPSTAKKKNRRENVNLAGCGGSHL